MYHFFFKKDINTFLSFIFEKEYQNMLSKTGRYGVRAVLYIAANTSGEHLIGVRKLSRDIGVSEHMLSKVLQFMTRRDIVMSKKGRNGGFYMTEAQKQRTIMDVIRVLEQTQHLLSSCLMGQKNCEQGLHCPYRDKVASIRSELREIYATDTIVQAALKIKNSTLKHI